MSVGNGFNKAIGLWKNPLKTIDGQKCKRCGKPATCAVLTTAILPACLECANIGLAKGYDIIFPKPEPLKEE